MPNTVTISAFDDGRLIIQVYVSNIFCVVKAEDRIIIGLPSC